MALYLIGDVQGCNAELGQLLERLDFSPSRDHVVVLGDLVNRGPDSAGVLRRLMRLEGAATCLLGNHDLHLLAIAAGAHPLRRGDTVADILAAPDREAMLLWLRHQRLAFSAQGCLMVHAGVPPAWTVERTLALAAEVEAVLQGSEVDEWLPRMYGDEPAQWNEGLVGEARLRVIVNCLTRMRFCRADGSMEFDTKGGPASAPPGFAPWYEHPARATASATVAFGHWSTLGLMLRPDAICLDTGCAWGGSLSALRWGDTARNHQLTQVPSLMQAST